MASDALAASTFDAILNLAALPPSPPSLAPPRRASPPSAGSVRVAIWDEQRGIKLSGAQAPTADELADFLKAHPRCAVYAGQQVSAPPASSALGQLPRPDAPMPQWGMVKKPSPAKRPLEYGGAPAAKCARGGAAATAESTKPAYVPATAATRQFAWANGGAAPVVARMRALPDCAQTQADGCGALAFLASGADAHKRRVCAEGGALAAARAIARHAPTLLVAQQGCGALAVLALEKTAREAVREAGGAAAVVRAMRLHPHAAHLQLLGCTALAALAELRTVPAEPLAAVVLAAMRAFPAEAPLQAQGCRALLQLAAGGPPRRRAVCDARGPDAVAGAMSAHLADAAVQQWGCGALAALAEGGGACAEAVLRAAGGGGARAAVAALRAHPGHPLVAQLGLAALAALVSGDGRYDGTPPTAAGGVASAAAAREVLACSGAAVAARAMANHGAQWLVQLQGCALLALLAGSGRAAADAVRAAGGAPAALAALGAHGALPEVVRWGERVLRALPHPLAPPAAVGAAALRARRLRVSRALLGSWGAAGGGSGGRGGGGGGGGGDAKLPLELLGKIAALAVA